MTLRPARPLRLAVAAIALLGQLGVAAAPAAAFCGFYVAKADGKLFNHASKVVLAWDDGKAAVTMASDYTGDPKEFAVVVPVPTFIERKQIGIVDIAALDHLDAYSAPRLVEYHDADRCMPLPAVAAVQSAPRGAMAVLKDAAPTAHGVTVEASYAVGEYGISILSARESDGLVHWLGENGYRLPPGRRRCSAATSIRRCIS